MKTGLNVKLAVYAMALTVLATIVGPGIGLPSTEFKGRIMYYYEVDGDGNTEITITLLYSGSTRGSSWVVVPSYLNWSHVVSGGTLLDVEVESIFRNGFEDPFWENFTFTFSSPERFLNLTINYTVPLYTFILEPDGLFYSSQIEYDKRLEGAAEVMLPSGSVVSYKDVELVVGSDIMTPSELRILKFPERRVIVRCETVSGSRIMIFFKLKDSLLREESYRLGIFNFYTASRYAEYAERFLKLYNRSIEILLNVFGVDVSSINVTFFLPDRSQFLAGLGGYVPFTGGKLGDIHLNIFYLRTLKGFLELIALHELIHQIVWYVGIEPGKLWVHEGMAEYFSLEIGELLGYKDAVESRRRDHERVLATIGEKYGFVQEWRIGSRPANIAAYYAASYKVFKTLGEKYGGLDYYKKFFRFFKENPGGDSSVITALGKAAGNLTEVVLMFKRWGFKGIAGLDEIMALIEEARRVAEEINPLLQPFKLISEMLVSMAAKAYEEGQHSRAFAYAGGSMFIAENALILTIATYGILAVLTVKLVHRRIKLKPVKPVAMFCPSCGSKVPEGAVYCPYCGRYLGNLRLRN